MRQPVRPPPPAPSIFERLRTGLEALKAALAHQDWEAAEQLTAELTTLTAEATLTLDEQQLRLLATLHRACEQEALTAGSDLEAEGRSAGNLQRAMTAYTPSR